MYINHGCVKKQKNIINLAESLYGKKINDSEFHEKCTSLKDYFVNLRKRIIELSNANEIVLSHKIFPAYVNDDFDKAFEDLSQILFEGISPIDFNSRSSKDLIKRLVE